MVLLMAAERIFDEADIQELLEQNAMPPHGARNVALILGGCYWGLTPLELCLVSTEDVIAPGGEFHRNWVLPEKVSFNGEARQIRTENHVLPFFEKYVQHRFSREWGLSDESHTYRGLKPNSKFFLNDQGDRYKPTERKDTPGTYQPRSMVEQLKRMIGRTNITGATPASFRDSYIKGLYEGGASWKDLMKASGIKQKRTLERKVRPQEREIEEVFQNLFSRVRVPESLK